MAFENWVEWKQKCDFWKCSPETQSVLIEYVERRWYDWVNNAIKRAKTNNIQLHELDVLTCWDLLASYCANSQSLKTKLYKDYIFHAVRTSKNNAVYTIEGILFTIFRDAIRNYIIKTYLPSKIISFEISNADEENSFTLLDILVPPGKENTTFEQAAQNEYIEIANNIAGTIFPELALRVRIGMAARLLGIPLSNPEVLQIADCGKSVMQDTYKQFILMLGNRMKGKYAPHEHVYDLTKLIVERLKNMCLEWAEAESSCARLFQIAEERKVDAIIDQ